MEFLQWLENTGLATWIRESNSILAYPTILFCHTLGLGTVAGLSAFVNLRVLGFARGLPFSQLRPFIGAIWAAFALSAISGTALFIANASAKATSPTFIVKLAFVALAMVTVHLIATRVVRNPEADRSPLPRQAQVIALVSIALWVGATTAGRLLAYLN
jgi:hypothetical protein